ncbi:cytochrome P450 [Amycolatopsis mediterranei S699]|uniref:Cytochrome P450 n=2 Tax=Amycolatopsis mediterranei TaxID=33910 RepID=A0A0H3D9Q8_AMYMU|nr:cytochrome P450 [Amycolatopsis mediterranei]ADJ47381.1 cytochrome P450 [Amycolatopsis mediterranei U32]AEK44225.1 cytochrome P450 [Amycolatopsis mediterranei S699]AFO79092.1 cytochrome P450 [Amycolatopsis mediterranei S699]AGT86220.1 cytochrome P450 [Amycolatopsis mediterranei RB]KDO12432.1 cytochrome P450 [Amycolatopsis mediterranei]
MVSVDYPFDTRAGADVDLEGLRLLEKAPLARARLDGGQDVWLALGYQVVRQVLSDPGFGREAATRPGGPVTNPAGANPELLVSMDPPRHTRVRALVAKAFSPRTVERLGPRVGEMVDGLLDELAVQPRPADLVRLLAEPLPILVICELLGVPDADRARIREWAGVLIAETAHTGEEIAAAIGQVDGYLGELIAQRRENPDAALISALIAVNDEAGHLSPSELVSNVQLLLIAGHETTVSQIGNSLVTLFGHPDQLKLLRERPELLPGAVEELLRHSKLTTSTLPRVAVRDVMVGDTLVRAGEAVIPVIAVANRDPAAFPEPHRFDISRTGPAPHVGLGHGPHYCLGAQLAKLELHVAIGGLLSRFPAVWPAVDLDELDWKPGLSTRSVRALPVTW